MSNNLRNQMLLLSNSHSNITLNKNGLNRKELIQQAKRNKYGKPFGHFALFENGLYQHEIHYIHQVLQMHGIVEFLEKFLDRDDMFNHLYALKEKHIELFENKEENEILIKEYIKKEIERERREKEEKENK
jgi:hypothetical protein